MNGLNIATLGIRVDANGASRNIDEFNSKLDKTAEKSSAVQRSLKQLAGVFASYKAVQWAREILDLGARYQTLGVVVEVVGRNAGKTAREMAEYQKELQRTGISAIGARESLTRMAQAQLDLAKSSELARVAQDAAVIANTNSSEAFQRLVYGIQSGQTEMLRTLGITVNFQNAYKGLSKELGIGIDQLTEAQKTQARFNTVLQQGVQITGTYDAAMDTAGKQLGSTVRYLEDVKVKVSEAFQPAYTKAVFAYANLLKLLGENAEKIATVFRGVLAAAMVYATQKTVGWTTSIVGSIRAQIAAVAASRTKAAADLIAAKHARDLAIVQLNMARIMDSGTGSMIRQRNAALALQTAHRQVSLATTAQMAATTGLAVRAMGLLRGTVAFLGGPLNIALMAAAGAWLLISRNTAKAREEAEKYRQAYRDSLGDMKSDQLMFLAIAKEQEAARLRTQRMALPAASHSLMTQSSTRVDPYARERNQLQDQENKLLLQAASIWEHARDQINQVRQAKQDAIEAANKEIQTRGMELSKLTALNDAYREEESVLRILSIQKDAAIQKSKDAAQYTGKELADLNLLTDAMTAQQIRAEHLAESKRKSLTQESFNFRIEDRLRNIQREREEATLLRQAQLEGVDAVNRLTVKLAGQHAVQELVNDAASSGTALMLSYVKAVREAAEVHAQQIIDDKQLIDAKIFNDELTERIKGMHQEAEILQRQTEARRQGQQTIDALRVKLAGEAAVREAMNNAIEKGTAVLLSDIKALRLAAEAREQAAINSDAQQKAHADAKQRWEKMLDSMQKHISSFWSDLFSNGIKSFKSLFDRVRQLFAQLVADLLAKRMVQRLSGVLATAIGLGGPQAASAQGMIGSIIPMGVNSNHGTSYPGTPVTSGWGQAIQLGGAGLGGFGIGYGLGSTTTHQGIGGFMGAAGGAASGFAIGGPAGAAIGSLTGLVGGLLGSSKAADEAEKQLRRMKESLELAMSAIRSEVNGTADSLSHSLLQANAQFKQLREQVEDTYRLNVWEAIGKETANSRERARLLSELNTLEEKRIQQLKEEFDLKIQHTQEDLQVRLLRAKGMDKEAEEMEFMLRQKREYDEMKKAGMDDETMALLAQVQIAEAAQFAAREIEKLTASLSNAPSGFKIAHDRYLATIASIPGEDVIGRPFADPRDIPSPNPPLITSNGGGMAMPQASGTTVIEFHGDLHITSSATNAAELFEEIQRKLQLEAARGGTTRFTLNTRTS